MQLIKIVNKYRNRSKNPIHLQQVTNLFHFLKPNKHFVI